MRTEPDHVDNAMSERVFRLKRRPVDTGARLVEHAHLRTIDKVMTLNGCDQLLRENVINMIALIEWAPEEAP